MKLNLITEKGNINYFGLIKSTLLISFLYGLFFEGISFIDKAIGESIIINGIVFGLLTIQLIIYIIAQCILIRRILRSIVLVNIYFSFTIAINKVYHVMNTCILYTKKMHLRFMVVRC